MENCDSPVRRLSKKRGYSSSMLAHFLVLHLIANFSLGSTKHGYTIEGIVDALKAAEAQAPVLKFDYSYEAVKEVAVDGSIKSRINIQATFARDIASGRFYEDRVTTLNDIVTGEIKNDPGDIVAFNGERMVHLERVKDHGQLRARIMRGRNEALLKFPNNPHLYYIRGYSGRLYSEWLDRKTSEFEIKSVEKQPNGNTIVELNGTVSSGRFIVSLQLCPELSYLPVKFTFTRVKDDVKGIEFSLKDFAELGDGSFYPETVVLGGDGVEPWGAFKIENISTEPIPKEFFEPEIPANTHVTDHILHVSYSTDDAANSGKSNK